MPDQVYFGWNVPHKKKLSGATPFHFYTSFVNFIIITFEGQACIMALENPVHRAEKKVVKLQ